MATAVLYILSNSSLAFVEVFLIRQQQRKGSRPGQDMDMDMYLTTLWHRRVKPLLTRTTWALRIWTGYSRTLSTGSASMILALLLGRPILHSEPGIVAMS